MMHRCDGCDQEIGAEEFFYEVQATLRYCRACVIVTSQEDLERGVQLLLPFESATTIALQLAE